MRTSPWALVIRKTPPGPPELKVVSSAPFRMCQAPPLRAASFQVAPFAGRNYSQLVQDEWLDGAQNSRGEPIAESNGLQTNNPGWPGFSSRGLILGAGVQLALLY